MKRIRRSLGVAIIVALFVAPAGSQGYRDDFQAAYNRALEYAVQWYEPGSPEYGISLFDDVIDGFLSHPRRDEVIFRRFKILSMSEAQGHMVRADSDIRMLMSSTRAGTALGVDVRLALVRFQVSKARRQPFEDLALAAIALDEIDASFDMSSLTRAKTVQYRSMLLRRIDRPVEALALLSEYYRETYSWPDSFWEEMRNSRSDEYKDFRSMFSMLTNEIQAVLNGSTDPQMAEILRNAPPGMFVNPRALQARENYERRQILRSNQSFDGVVDEVLGESMGGLHGNIENEGQQRNIQQSDVLDGDANGLPEEVNKHGNIRSKEVSQVPLNSRWAYSIILVVLALMIAAFSIYAIARRYKWR